MKSIEEIRDMLGRLGKLKLGFYPTPFHRLDRISGEYGVELYVKREDFSGMTLFGGNKIRKLEYLLHDAIRQGCDTVVTYGATQSNHAMETATAARKCGLNPVLFLAAIVEPNAADIRANLLLDTILGALLLAPIARGIAFLTDPVVNAAMGYIGNTITAATDQSPVLMGFLLGGIIKMICTSPLSSMALTAMLGLTGLPMGIAAIACFGGSFTNGIIFAQLKLGKPSNIAAVMLEPLTQAHIITRHPIPIYGSNFFGGGLAGIAAALLGIVNNAPGTASPIPGLLAPFAFNPPVKVLIALALGAVGGTLAGFAGSIVFKKFTQDEA